MKAQLGADGNIWKYQDVVFIGGRPRLSMCHEEQLLGFIGQSELPSLEIQLSPSDRRGVRVSSVLLPTLSRQMWLSHSQRTPRVWDRTNRQRAKRRPRHEAAQTCTDETMSFYVHLFMYQPRTSHALLCSTGSLSGDNVEMLQLHMSDCGIIGSGRKCLLRWGRLISSDTAWWGQEGLEE